MQQALNIPKRISGAILASLASGVVPRTGLEYIAIGRTREIAAILGMNEKAVNKRYQRLLKRCREILEKK